MAAVWSAVPVSTGRSTGALEAPGGTAIGLSWSSTPPDGVPLSAWSKAVRVLSLRYTVTASSSCPAPGGMLMAVWSSKRG